MSYANIAQFGNTRQSPSNSDDPLTFCLADTYDNKFLHGSTSATSGPRSRQCQNYFAQRCAQNWDGFCEYFYREQGLGGTWPNNRVWPNMGTPNQWLNKGGSTMSLGQQMLHDAAERRFCTYTACQPHQERFDPQNPQSPIITSYQAPYGGSGSSGCIPVCRVNPATIDQDVLMDRALADPDACYGTIINICNTAAREGTDLSGTKIGAVCANYKQLTAGKPNLPNSMVSGWGWPKRQ